MVGSDRRLVDRILEIRCPNQLTSGFICFVRFLSELKKCPTQTP